MKKIMKSLIVGAMAGMMAAALPVVAFASEIDLEQEQAFLSGLECVDVPINTSYIIILAVQIIILVLGLYLDIKLNREIH